MEKIRKGNDIEVQWAIYAGYGINEAPYDLTRRLRFLRLKVASILSLLTMLRQQMLTPSLVRRLTPLLLTARLR